MTLTGRSAVIIAVTAVVCPLLLAGAGHAAAQSPAEPHDIEVAFTLPAALVPGNRVAVCQIPAGAAPAGTRVPAAA